jgi:hypothetical protein
MARPFFVAIEFGRKTFVLQKIFFVVVVIRRSAFHLHQGKEDKHIPGSPDPDRPLVTDLAVD